MTYTKGQIDRLGNKIRKEGKIICEETLFELQEYRISHKDSISKIFNTLCQLSKKITKESIVTYRIKRFESIISKLSRHPSMNFNRMWDIGGCRCILRNEAEIRKLQKLIESKLVIRKTNDYLVEPQEDGYKSLHLYVSLPDDDKVIEVQLRNHIDHNWATLVEITDLLFNVKIKELGNHPALSRFHYLLSKRENLNIEEKREIVEIIKDHNYFDRLSEVFARNYIRVRKQWFEIENKSNHKFFLIEVREDEVPKIESFHNFQEAEKQYFTLYKSTQNANIVLTHLPEPSYKQISIAYSNYILTFHSFLDDCYSIFESLIVDSLRERKLFDFIKFFDLYNSMVFNRIKNLVTEIGEVNEILNQPKETKKIKTKIKEKEWINDINNQIKRGQLNQRNLSILVHKNKPDAFFQKLIFERIMKNTMKKYDRKLKNVLSKQNV